jgi:hypothetical protein
MSVSKRQKPKHQSKKSLPHEQRSPEHYWLSGICSRLTFLGRMLASTVIPGWHAIVSVSVVSALAAFAANFLAENDRGCFGTF